MQCVTLSAYLLTLRLGRCCQHWSLCAHELDKWGKQEQGIAWGGHITIPEGCSYEPIPPTRRTTEAISEQPWPVQVLGPSERFRISSFKMHLVGSFFSFHRTTVPSGLTRDGNVIYSNLTQMLWAHKSSFIFSKSWMWSTPQFSCGRSMTLQPSWQSCSETTAALDRGKTEVGVSTCGHG